MTDDGHKLVPKAVDILNFIFRKFATGQTDEQQILVMTRADFRNYVLTCGAGQHSANDKRLDKVFGSYGDGRRQKSVKRVNLSMRKIFFFLLVSV